MSHERRRFPRRYFERKVGVLSEGTYLIAQGVEIGEGGMMFSVNREISEDRRLLVTFRIPNHGFVVIQAFVRNTQHEAQRFRYGIQFSDLDFTNRRRIRDYIAEKTEGEAMLEKQLRAQEKK